MRKFKLPCLYESLSSIASFQTTNYVIPGNSNDKCVNITSIRGQGDNFGFFDFNYEGT